VLEDAAPDDAVPEVAAVEVAAVEDAAEEDAAEEDAVPDDAAVSGEEVSGGETAAEVVVPEGETPPDDGSDGAEVGAAEACADDFTADDGAPSAEVSAAFDLLQATALNATTATSTPADTLRHIVVRIPERSVIWSPRRSERCVWSRDAHIPPMVADGWTNLCGALDIVVATPSGYRVRRAGSGCHDRPRVGSPP